MDRQIATTGVLSLRPVPGLDFRPFCSSAQVDLRFQGTLGIRELNRLIEEATKLRDELQEAIG